MINTKEIKTICNGLQYFMRIGEFDIYYNSDSELCLISGSRSIGDRTHLTIKKTGDRTVSNEHPIEVILDVYNSAKGFCSIETLPYRQFEIWEKCLIKTLMKKGKEIILI